VQHQRWQARSLPLSSTRLLVGFAIGTPLLLPLVVLDQTIHAAGVGICIVAAIVGAVVATRALRAAASVTEITFDGDALTLTRGGKARPHRLTTGSLHASRSFHGTVLYIRLPDGVTTLAVPALLPEDRYAEGRTDHADLYLETGAGGEALLEQVRRYIMPRRPGEPRTAAEDEAPIFSLSLEGSSRFPRLSILISGDTMALSNPESGDLLARARVAEIDAKPFSYHRGADDLVWSHPGVRLRFPDRADELIVGTVLFEGGPGDWWGTSAPERSASPDYNVTPAEFAHLVDALGLRKRGEPTG
jgi:hypothetical protein